MGPEDLNINSFIITIFEQKDRTWHVT